MRAERRSEKGAVAQAGELDRRSRRIRRWIIGAFVALGVIGVSTQLIVYIEFAHGTPQATAGVSQRDRVARAIDEIGDDVSEARRLLALAVTHSELGSEPRETA